MKYFLVTIILLLSLGGCGRSAPSPPDQEMAEFEQAQLECMRRASNFYPPLMRSNGPDFQTDLNDVPRLKAVNECLYAKGYN